MTQLGGGSRQIARLLQAKAPPNHILAYITPEEADFLEARGGSGEPDPETGIPTFQEEDPTGGGEGIVDTGGGSGGDYVPFDFDFQPSDAGVDLFETLPPAPDLGPVPSPTEIPVSCEPSP